jgi:hypothetical protein
MQKEKVVFQAIPNWREEQPRTGLNAPRQQRRYHLVHVGTNREIVNHSRAHWAGNVAISFIDRSREVWKLWRDRLLFPLSLLTRKV